MNLRCHYSKKSILYKVFWGNKNIGGIKVSLVSFYIAKNSGDTDIIEDLARGVVRTQLNIWWNFFAK